jgi:FkbM family methyltransferase
MSILKKFKIKASENHLVQYMLEKRVHALQDLMGIGSGDEASSSGERAIFKTLQKELQPPYCIFDVGSNQGQFLQLALENIETDKFNIHCFEPSHETFVFLQKNSPKDKKIKLNNIGFGKEKGEARLYFDNFGSGLASLTKRKLDHFSIPFDKSEIVKIDTIDNYCSDNKISRINLLKLDIEGHELEAFMGAEKMFNAKAIDIVTFEFGGCNIDTRTFFQDFWYFFKKIDMKIFRITPSGYFYPIESYKEVYEQFRTTNFIAQLSN